MPDLVHIDGSPDPATPLSQALGLKLLSGNPARVSKLLAWPRLARDHLADPAERPLAIQVAGKEGS